MNKEPCPDCWGDNKPNQGGCPTCKPNEIENKSNLQAVDLEAIQYRYNDAAMYIPTLITQDVPALIAEIRALRALFIEYRKWHRTEYHNNNNNNELEERVNQVLGEYK